MRIIGEILIFALVIGLLACGGNSDSYEQIGFYTMVKNEKLQGKDTAVIKNFVGGKLESEMIFGSISDDSKELLRYNKRGDMTYSKLIVPSAGYLSLTEMTYADAAYLTGLKTSVEVAGQSMDMEYRYEETKTNDQETLQQVYDMGTDSLVGTTQVTLNEQGLVSMRIESWIDEPGSMETYKYNAEGQKKEVKTMPQHDHSDHHGHDHGDETVTTTFTYEDGILVQEVSAIAGQSLTTEYFYEKDRLKKIVKREVMNKVENVTEISF